MVAGFFCSMSNRGNCAGAARIFWLVTNRRSVMDWMKSTACATRRRANGWRRRTRTDVFSCVRLIARNACSGFSCILLASGEDGRVYCVEYPKAKRQLLLLKSEKPVWSVAWSPDRKWIAAVGDEGRVWIWSTRDFLPAATPKRLAGDTEAKSRLTPSKSRPATNHRS